MSESEVKETKSSTGVFLRKASGVYRSWSPLDGWIYNVLAMNVVVMISFTYYTATYLFPKGNLTLAIIITGIICTFEALVYAMMTAAMPRSGGDYIFQSRIFSGGLGSVLAFTAIVSAGAMWLAIAGWLGTALCTSPFFVLIGSVYKIKWMVDFGVWLTTPAGFFLVTLIVIGWAAIINIWGMRPYALLQRWSFAIGLICLVAMFIVLLTNSHNDFILKLNEFMLNTFNQPDAYNSVIAAAKNAGYSPAQMTGFGATIAIIPLAAFSLIYPAWGVAQAGEIKSGTSLRSQIIQMPLAEVFSFIVAAGLAALLVNRFGSEFLSSVGYLYTEASDVYPLPVEPLFATFIGILAGNPLFLILVFIAFNAWFWMWHPNITLAASRVLLAMSFDRVLPEKIGEVHPKTRTPVVAIIFFSIICIIFGALYSFTGFWKLTLATAILNIICFGTSCLAGALMPYIKPNLYKDTPAAKWKIGNIPFITIAGFIFFIFAIWMVITLLTNSTYGINNPLSLIFMGVLYAIAIVIYFGYKSYRRKQGIDVSIAYKDIPVE
ncbi:MAG: APC family permease [Desulfobacterales bacterium]|nr:APC family permease [Desulfobacterales bacterium]